jgi:transposase
MIKLTQRQHQVITLMRAGKSRSEIAQRLGIYHLTVWGHQNALTNKGILGPRRPVGGNTPRGILKDGRSYRVVS